MRGQTPGRGQAQEAGAATRPCRPGLVLGRRARGGWTPSWSRVDEPGRRSRAAKERVGAPAVVVGWERMGAQSSGVATARQGSCRNACSPRVQTAPGGAISHPAMSQDPRPLTQDRASCPKGLPFRRLGG